MTRTAASCSSSLSASSQLPLLLSLSPSTIASRPGTCGGGFRLRRCRSGGGGSSSSSRRRRASASRTPWRSSSRLVSSGRAPSEWKRGRARSASASLRTRRSYGRFRSARIRSTWRVSICGFIRIGTAPCVDRQSECWVRRCRRLCTCCILVICIIPVPLKYCDLSTFVVQVASKGGFTAFFICYGLFPFSL